MGLKISGRLFYGPSPIEDVVVKKNHSPVVFAIVSRGGEPWNPVFRLLDVGFSGTEGIVLSDHPSVPQWKTENDGILQVYLLDLKRKDGDPAERADVIIREFQAKYQPPKGTISLAE
jgi:hypothetical protein